METVTKYSHKTRQILHYNKEIIFNEVVYQ
jgi:hypothetical protein